MKYITTILNQDNYQKHQNVEGTNSLHSKGHFDIKYIENDWKMWK